MKPTEPIFHCWKGQVLQSFQKYTESIESYKEALKLDPNHDEANMSTAITYLFMGQHEESIKWVNKVIELNPNSHVAYNCKGNNLIKLNKFEAALDCFEKAIKLKPDYSTALSNIGSILVTTGRFSESLEYYDRSINGDSMCHSSYYMISVSFSNLDKYVEAKQSIDKAMEMDQKNLHYLKQRIVILKKLGRMDEAEKYYKQAVKIDKNVSTGWQLKNL